ncbi:MAG: Flp pilus assembly protein TadB [Candidatus Nanohaloarchaea archaeon]|jgi:Flp pilus assembly protein TadB
MNNDRIKLIYESLPEKYRDTMELEAKYASITNLERLTVSLGSISIFITLIGSLLLPYSMLVRSAVFTISAPAIALLVPYLIVSIAAERRKNEIENVLPDALLLISANLKSGVSIDKAFLMSARDEFGPLAEELRLTAMEMFSGEPVEESLMEMEDRVKSELFKETLKLLVDGIQSGGNTAQLLESSAEDIRNSLELQQEINSNIRMYVIFILMAAVVGAPLLFSISVYMSQTTADMWSGTNVGEMQTGGELGLSFQAPEVNTAFFEQFSVMAIIAINFFAAIIISEIKNANIKEGAKYIPVMITISVVLFFIVKNGISSVMGGMV